MLLCAGHVQQASVRQRLSAAMLLVEVRKPVQGAPIPVLPRPARIEAPPLRSAFAACDQPVRDCANTDVERSETVERRLMRDEAHSRRDPSQNRPALPVPRRILRRNPEPDEAPTVAP